MKFVPKALVAVAVLAASSLSLADDLTNTGLYLSLDAGQATMSASVDLGQTGDGSVGVGTWSMPDEHNTDFRLGVGYTFNDYVSAEFGYTRYDNIYNWFDPLANSAVTVPTPSAFTDDFAINITNVQSIDLSVLVGTSVGENFRMYLRGGYEAWDMKAQAASMTTATKDRWNKWGYLYGFGFQLDMTDHLSLRNEYVWHKFDDDDINLDTQSITVGLLYSF